jgi:hypothetical protein
MELNPEMNEHEANTTAAPVTTDWGSRSHVQTLVIMAATVFGIYLCYRLALPFLPALAWAAGVGGSCSLRFNGGLSRS